MKGFDVRRVPDVVVGGLVPELVGVDLLFVYVVSFLEMLDTSNTAKDVILRFPRVVACDLHLPVGSSQASSRTSARPSHK